jgi:hypothetical protein
MTELSNKIQLCHVPYMTGGNVCDAVCMLDAWSLIEVPCRLCQISMTALWPARDEMSSGTASLLPQITT